METITKVHITTLVISFKASPEAELMETFGIRCRDSKSHFCFKASPEAELMETLFT